MYSSCPCCAFSTNDLFLPPSERQQATEIDESTETNASHEDDSSSSKLPSGYFLSPLESLEHLSTTPLVDTHGHAHLQRHQDDEEEKNEYHNAQDVDNDTNPCNPFNNIVSLTCSVAPSDWLDCLKYAAQYKHRRAAIGVHPWYLNELLVNNNEISRNDDDADTVESNTQLNPTWLSDMESLLQQHPGCMIGEIGLCKMARFVRTYPGGKTQALQLQRHVLEQQLKLAVQYQRPASIHCVQQQGVLLDLFRHLFTPPIACRPPSHCIHFPVLPIKFSNCCNGNNRCNAIHHCFTLGFHM